MSLSFPLRQSFTKSKTHTHTQTNRSQSKYESFVSNCPAYKTNEPNELLPIGPPPKPSKSLKPRVAVVSYSVITVEALLLLDWLRSLRNSLQNTQKHTNTFRTFFLLNVARCPNPPTLIKSTSTHPHDTHTLKFRPELHQAVLHIYRWWLPVLISCGSVRSAKQIKNDVIYSKQTP